MDYFSSKPPINNVQGHGYQTQLTVKEDMEQMSIFNLAQMPFSNKGELDDLVSNAMTEVLKTGTPAEKEVIFKKLISVIADTRYSVDLRGDLAKIRDTFLGVDAMDQTIARYNGDTTAILTSLRYAWGGGAKGENPNIENLKVTALNSFPDDSKVRTLVNIEFNNIIRDKLKDELSYFVRTRYEEVVNKNWSSYDEKKKGVQTWCTEQLKKQQEDCSIQ